MPCIVPTCLHIDDRLRPFPNDEALAARWLEAIESGCGYSKMQFAGSVIQLEICSVHFQNLYPGNYEEPSLFLHSKKSHIKINSCRVCLAFYSIEEMVPLEGTIGEKTIAALLESLGVSHHKKHFLDLICLSCIAKMEIITFLHTKFLQSELIFQELLKKSQITDQYAHSKAERCLLQVDIVNEEGLFETETDIQDSSDNEYRNLGYQNQSIESKVSDKSQFSKNKKPIKPSMSLKEKLERYCYICNTIQEDANQLMIHLTNSHTSEMSYRCVECLLDIPSLYGYNRHLSRHDTSQRPFKCSACSMCFKSNFWVKLHENKKHGTNHDVKRAKSKSREIICDQCGKISGCQCPKEHTQQVHRKESQPKCTICGKTFTTKRSLERHMLLHANAKPYSCDQCEATFRRLLNYRHHKSIVHDGVNPHVCSECNQEFKNYQRLYVHKRKNHPKNSTTLYYQQYETCKICQLRFAKGSELLDHIRTGHSGEQYPVNKCPHCPKTFMLSIQLRTHKLIHSDRYTCKQCGVGHVNKRKLQYHMDLKHSVGRMYTCSDCTKTFTSLHQLTLHSIIHTKGKQFQCEFCTKTFLRKFQLAIHARIHTGEKPFQCDRCLKRFGDDRVFCKHKKGCQALLAKKNIKLECPTES